MTRGTLTQLFFTTTDRHAGLPAAFRSKVGGTWKAITHRETLERVQAISLGLRELRIAPGDKVAIVSENRPERSEEHTSELQSRLHLVCRLLLEKKKKRTTYSPIQPCQQHR